MSVMDNFYEISPNELGNASELIGNRWMLITAKDNDKVNAMTASWGCLGVLWNKPVAVGFVRPQRHTFGLTETEERISLAFLDEDRRDALKLCGTKSGRDMDKITAAGLTTELFDGVPVICEARTLLICRKLYVGNIEESGFVDKKLLDNYKLADYHRVYVWEIEKVLERR